MMVAPGADLKTFHQVTVVGTPAEEDIGGKIELIKAGAFADIDLVFMAHPAQQDASFLPCVALDEYVPVLATRRAPSPRQRPGPDRVPVPQGVGEVLREGVPCVGLPLGWSERPGRRRLGLQRRIGAETAAQARVEASW